MNLIWGMMNDLSFVVSMSLISITIPGIASSIQSLLMQLIYMDLLMTDAWLSPLMERAFFSDEIEEDTPVNMHLDEQGFTSRLAIFNLGSTLVFFSGQVIVLLITAAAYVCSCYSKR